MKICPVGPELFHAVRWTDRQTDMMKVIVALCNFMNAPKNQQLSVNKIGIEPVLGKSRHHGKGMKGLQTVVMVIL